MTRQEMIRSKYRSRASARSRIPSSTAGEEAIWRNVIWTGCCIETYLLQREHSFGVLCSRGLYAGVTANPLDGRAASALRSLRGSDALDHLLRSVGLAFSRSINENKIL